MNPHVCSASPLPKHRLMLEFTNGERRIFDLSPYLTIGVFKQLQDLAKFSAARVVAGSIEWPEEIDLSYDTLYLKSQAAESVQAA